MFKKDTDSIKDLNIGAEIIIKNSDDLCKLPFKDLLKLRKYIEKNKLNKIIFGDKFLSDYDPGMIIIILDLLFRYINDKEAEEAEALQSQNLEKFILDFLNNKK